jgi:hypothetical protein
MVAEFEANLGHLHTREGMALAKKNGKLKGKQPKLPEPARRSIRRRYAEGEVSLPTWPPSTASDAPPSTAPSTASSTGRPPGRADAGARPQSAGDHISSVKMHTIGSDTALLQMRHDGPRPLDGADW